MMTLKIVPRMWGVLICVGLLLFNGRAFAAELTINLIAVNPSETKTREIDVKYPLPKELQPSDVVDSGELKVDYDVDKGQYFAFGKITFQPKESKTFRIRVNDVWHITEEEIDILKQNMDGNLSLLEKTPQKYENAKKERDRTFQQLDFILAQQQNYSENIERRIEQYRAYAGVIEKVRKRIYDPNYLDQEAQVQPEDDAKTLKFILQVKNPSDEEDKAIKHKHFLPAEIRQEDVVDPQGFDVRYDDKKGKSYIIKEEEFKAGETKRYEIVLKDIWRFPVAKLTPLEQRANIAMAEIKESAYYSSGKYLYDEVIKNVNLIRETQELTLPPEQHIGIFRTNEKRYDDLKQNVERIEQMLAIVRAKKLEELEGSKVKNILKRLQALRGLQALSEAIFKKGITVTMTWRIIGACILFVAFFTTYHFFLWAKRSGKMGEELALKDGEQIKVVPKPTPAARSEK